MKWRVERAGTPGRYLHGWFALLPGGTGAWFSTWSEAVAFVGRMEARGVGHASTR